MSMETWMLSCCIIAMEVWGNVYFFDTFMKKKREGRMETGRYFILFLAFSAVVGVDLLVGSMAVKVLLGVLVSVMFCETFYQTGWKQSVFFSVLNYCLLLLMDFFSLQIENIWISKAIADASKMVFLALPAKIIWTCLLFAFRRIWKGRNSYGELSGREWLKLGTIPFFSMMAMLLMFFCYRRDKETQMVYLFLTAGLIAMNFLVLELMQNILKKGELLRISMLTNQKTESQLMHYRDMQAVYERQGKKMHDYKNQIKTIQVLLKEGNTQAAVSLAEKLTESISVEMSAVNTNHPIVNAVLNQKFHAAREQGVSMIFKVSDMSGLRLDEEETVILLANLLDNAIHESRRVVQTGKKAVIHIKLVQEGGRLLFSVRNPVVEKVMMVDGMVPCSGAESRGIGLSNVKAVADRYGGDFAVYCDEEKFQAVVML